MINPKSPHASTWFRATYNGVAIRLNAIAALTQPAEVTTEGDLSLVVDPFAEAENDRRDRQIASLSRAAVAACDRLLLASSERLALISADSAEARGIDPAKHEHDATSEVRFLENIAILGRSAAVGALLHQSRFVQGIDVEAPLREFVEPNGRIKAVVPWRVHYNLSCVFVAASLATHDVHLGPLYGRAGFQESAFRALDFVPATKRLASTAWIDPALRALRMNDPTRFESIMGPKPTTPPATPPKAPADG